LKYKIAFQARIKRKNKNKKHTRKTPNKTPNQTQAAWIFSMMLKDGKLKTSGGIVR